jgi:hypothetical protein
MQDQARGGAGDQGSEKNGEGDKADQLALLGEVDAAAQSIGDTKDGDGGFADVASGKSEGFPYGVAEAEMADDVAGVPRYKEQ